jgi:hypothetical protein
LDEFDPVSIKMAKTQNLSLNPTKISGTCGRLMCCLKYEQDAYEDLVAHAPKMESFVETPDGAGTVSGVNLLRQTVQVRLESDPDTPKTYHNSELTIVRSGKGKRPEGYVEPPVEELAKLRRPAEDKTPVPAPEESSLAAALEAVFARREEPNPPPVPMDGGEEDSRRRNSRPRRKKPRGEGQERPESRERPVERPRPQRPQQPAATPQPKPPRAAADGQGREDSPKRPYRRRRPRRNWPRPTGGQE